MSAIFKPDFYIIPGVVRDDPKLNEFDGFVYAVVYWFERLKDGKCTAGNGTIAGILNSTVGSVQNSLNRLEQQGFIRRTYKDRARRVRSSIECQVRYAKVSLPGDSVPLPSDTQVPLTGEENKNTEKREKKAEGSTPHDDAVRFFANQGDAWASCIAKMVLKGFPEDWAREEVMKFVSYWTELTPGGKKQRWQTERAFEVWRRLATWINKAAAWHRQRQQRRGKQIIGDAL